MTDRQSLAGILALALLAASCAPVPLVVREPSFHVQEVRFVDGTSDSTIEDALVVPGYQGFSGMRYGHGQELGSKWEALSDARIQRSGQALSLPGRWGVGIWWFPWLASTGGGSSLGGVLVVAVGYRPRWVAEPRANEAFTPLALEALPRADAIRQLEEVGDILRRDSVSPEDARRLGIPERPRARGALAEEVISLQFQPEEREMIRGFLSSGIRALGAKVDGMPAR